MTPHSSTLAWKIPWTEEPGRLQSMGSQRVGHGWATSLSFFTFMHWRRKWQPTPVFLPGESQGGGAWWAAVHGVAKSRTWLSDFTFMFTFHVHALKKEMATHSSVLAWRLPGTGSYRVRHDWSDSSGSSICDMGLLILSPWNFLMGYWSWYSGWAFYSAPRI